jgi:hypothetical protein
MDYALAKSLLQERFTTAEAAFLDHAPPALGEQIRAPCDRLFQSKTQAYREVLLGCVIAKLVNPEADITRPYVGRSASAFNGRTLDERVVNPFFHAHHVPSSRGPYLSVFRRSVAFDQSTREGLRDKPGYNALLSILGTVQDDADAEHCKHILDYLLFKFVELRGQTGVELLPVERLRLDQYKTLINSMLTTPSGGRLPVLFVVAAFQAIKEHFRLDWELRWQGINVADARSGESGDVTILSQGRIMLAAEVTERVVDISRVTATFNTKIGPASIEDYLFFFTGTGADAAARQQARQYFAQGHEVSFVEITDWILMVLTTIGQHGRRRFNETLVKLLSARDTPSVLKNRWNEVIQSLAGG